MFQMTPVELVKAGLRSPVRLFIKDEPHSRKKVLSGKWRLISGVSLSDQVFERLICSRQNLAEIESWESCSSKPGLGLDDDSLLTISGNLEDLLSRGELMAMDVRGWDWSVQDWELRADAESRRLLAGASEGSLFAFLLRVQAYCVANSVYVLPDGQVLSQVNPGVQLSGSYNTSSSNSRMRIIATLVARLLAGHPVTPVDMMAMGDDSVERYYEGVKEYLERLGHETKECVRHTTLPGVEFCSHVWKEDRFAEPVNPSKTLYRYLSHPHGSASYLDWYAQLVWIFRHSGSWTKYRDLAFARAERANKL